MGFIWFWIVAVMIVAYVVLDGFDIGVGESSALESHQIQSTRSNVEIGVKKIRRYVAVHARVAADHRQSADPRKLMDHDAAGNKRLILHFHVTRDQRAAGDHCAVPDPAIVRDVAGRHDVVFVADDGLRFGRGPAGNGVMLADDVPVADF